MERAASITRDGEAEPPPSAAQGSPRKQRTAEAASQPGAHLWFSLFQSQLIEGDTNSRKAENPSENAKHPACSLLHTHTRCCLPAQRSPKGFPGVTNEQNPPGDCSPQPVLPEPRCSGGSRESRAAVLRQGTPSEAGKPWQNHRLLEPSGARLPRRYPGSAGETRLCKID